MHQTSLFIFSNSFPNFSDVVPPLITLDKSIALRV